MITDDDSGYAALIGDIAASRSSSDRRGLQEAVASALAATSRELSVIAPLTLTVGDEFQGLFRTLGDAIEATVWIRLMLAGRAGVRFGIGWGSFLMVNRATFPQGQDGPAWWAARRALERGTEESRRPEGAKALRTWFVSWKRLARESSPAEQVRWKQLELPDVSAELGPPGSLPGEIDDYVNAFLACRDQLIGQLNVREASSLISLLKGQRQADISRQQGITQSAISQRFSRNGSYALKLAQELLGAEPS